MEALKNQIFSISDYVRYVAIYANDKLISGEKSSIKNTSSSESDKYEELIVNPTLLKLVIQRGNIDCGGVEYVIIRYGSFFEFVMPDKKWPCFCWYRASFRHHGDHRQNSAYS